ncbi:MAG: creatininase family protein [Anaerolineae bacterium]|nr:creatininase family protein [Anaerolineae bacterium]
MQWENLTASDFAQAVKEYGVCIVPFGVLEKHSEHLPLGTDFLVAHDAACRAADRAGAVVFPPFCFGQIYEARTFPGTVTLKPTLLLDLLQGILDEIGRNGFQKVILYNGHGGNNHLLRFLAQCTLWEPKPYSVYLYTADFTPQQETAWNALLETPLHGHACECETSMMLACRSELVHMERVPETPANPLQRMKQVPNAFAGISWYADYPDHYAGDARPATAEKGQALREIIVSAFADFIEAVKRDAVVPALEQEFFQHTKW